MYIIALHSTLASEDQASLDLRISKLHLHRIVVSRPTYMFSDVQPNLLTSRSHLYITCTSHVPHMTNIYRRPGCSIALQRASGRSSLPLISQVWTTRLGSNLGGNQMPAPPPYHTQRPPSPLTMLCGWWTQAGSRRIDTRQRRTWR